MFFAVDGSNNSMIVVIINALSLLFITEALIVALSPLRRNRGILGCTIIGLLANTLRAKWATSKSLLYAMALNNHVVLAFGTVNEYVKCPRVSGVSIGRKNANGVSVSRNVMLGEFESSGESDTDCTA